MKDSSPPDHITKPLKRKRRTIYDSLLRYAELLGFGDIHIKIDQQTGLKAIIAIHSLKRGPAIGGCRLFNYQTADQATEDALRLAYMMSLKAAINNLPHGGAKAVLIQPEVIKDRVAYFEKFGDFVHELGGRYVTAVDIGTNMHDMDVVATRTPYVTCTTHSGGEDDPSPLTALGVLRAIEASVKFKLNRESLEGIHVAIQGVGHVGYALAKDLHEKGARLTVTDTNKQALDHCREMFSATICRPDEIIDIEADVFAPCAFGAVLNLNTINRLNVKIVAGSANNQLAHQRYSASLDDRGILYAPDFLINAGGLIHVAVLYDHGSLSRSMQQINQIYDTVYDIFERAAREHCSPNVIAERIALERLR